MNLIKKYSNFILDVLINMGAFGFYIFAQQFIFMPIMSQNLSEIDFAHLVIYISIFAVISNVLGSELGIVRQVREDINDSGQYTKILMIFSLFILLVSPFILYLIGFEIVDCIFLAIAILLANLRMYCVAFYRLNKNFKKVLIQNIIYCIGLVLGIFLFFIFKAIWLPLIVAELFTSVYYVKHTDIIKGKPKTVLELKQVLSVYKNLGLISLLGNCVAYLDKIIIYPILGAGAVAVYYATTVMSKVISLIVNPLQSVILSWLKVDDENLKNKIVFKTIKISIPIMISIFILSIPITFFAIKLLYPQYLFDAINLLIPVCISIGISSVISLVKAILLKYSNSNSLVKVYIVHFVILIIMAIFLSKYYGIIGFAYANVISKIVLWIGFVYMLKQILNIKEEKNEKQYI